MAFRDTAKKIHNLPKHPDNLFYNTDGFVGSAHAAGEHPGSHNRTDDVMLVQHFLKIIAMNPDKLSHPFHRPKNAPTMNVDGKLGTITQTWIDAFQKHLVRIGKPVFPDGVVDRVRNGGDPGPHGHKMTLVLLNVGMGQITGDELWDAWWKEPDVPALLRDSVRDPGSST